MDFIDDLRQFARKIETLSPHIKTEEASKTSLILPFIQLLGYDIFDPTEVVPEFTADVGTKKGEKVDYAILRGGQPAILVEAKSIDDPLMSHESQLFRYFTTTPAKFAILTNGVRYKFYSDLEEPNKMDETPFLEIDLLDLKEPLVAELKKFHKESFDPEALFSAAANLKYVTQIQATIGREINDPSPDFCRFFLREIKAGKVIRQSVLDRFRPLVKKALSQFITNTLNDLLKSAIANSSESSPSQTEQPAPTPQEEEKERIVTTAEELEGFFIIKSLLRDVISPKRITYRDNLRCFTVFLDGSDRKWICRLYFNGPKKCLATALENKSENRIPIDDVEDIFKHEAELKTAAQRYVGDKEAS